MGRKKLSDSEGGEEQGKKEPVSSSFDFFNKLKTGNAFADNNVPIETKEFIDTGCYAFNAILSGDIFQGSPNNRIMMLAGVEQVGKTFFAIHAFCKKWVEKGYFIYYIDTEGSVDEKMLVKFGLTKDQFKILPEEVVEKIRFTMTTILDQLEVAMDGGTTNVNKCAFVMDSQGQLDTLKSRRDSAAGKDTQDLTLQKELKKLYKNITGRMAKMDVPFLVTNHTYDDNMSFIKKTIVSGGQGALYASSVILHLRKKQYKEGDVRKGTIVTAKIYKSRWCREGSEASFYLNFEKGLNKFYGLHDFAIKANLIEKWEKAACEKKGIVSPEKPGNFNWYVIKDPKIDPSKWVVCKETEIHKEETIGTILNEINEWVTKNIKLLRPMDFEYDAELEEGEDSETMESDTELT